MQRLALQSPENSGTRSITIKDTITCGGADLWIIAGPCAVESEVQLDAVAQTLKKESVGSIRGGAYKPRTSPYSFQGHGEYGLGLLRDTADKHNLVVVSEIMAIEQLEAMLEHVDVLQIGARNMQNFGLLEAVGKTDKPVLLKRGLSATLDEFLWAAEYVMSGGNHRVILCERGIRSFDKETRNVLDLGGVAVLKQKSHLPVVVDPSHAAGRRDIISALARAAVAVGADGIIVETHPEPDQSISDAAQALSFEEFSQLMQDIRPIAAAMGKVLSPSLTHA
jgi:3-deoxy-7-phosphoheptulonate synthase